MRSQHRVSLVSRFLSLLFETIGYLPLIDGDLGCTLSTPFLSEHRISNDSMVTFIMEDIPTLNPCFDRVQCASNEEKRYIRMTEVFN